MRKTSELSPSFSWRDVSLNAPGRLSKAVGTELWVRPLSGYRLFLGDPNSTKKPLKTELTLAT